MRIALVVNAYHPRVGGVETHVRRLAAGLATSDEVEVLTQDRTVDRSHRLICVSQAEKSLLLRHFPGARDRTVVVPNGIDPGPFVAAGQRTRSVLYGEGYVLALGRLERYKRLGLVLAALRHLS